MSEQFEAFFGLPQEVKFCRKCVMSNQRPCSTPEFNHNRRQRHTTLHFDQEEVCDACRYAEEKEKINWEAREKELLDCCDKYRKTDGSYDCLVPGSGGKDSVYASHLLKYKYGMHPLTVTWPPLMYTDYGYLNFKNWLEVCGFDNISYKPNGRVMKLLTRLGIENLLHPFQTFILGQKNLAVTMAINMDIPLIFYGESEAEYGNPIIETSTSLRDKSYYSMKNLDEIYLGGVSIPELRERYSLELNDLMIFLPPNYKIIEEKEIAVHYLGYYVKWTPQEAYYYAVEHSNFEARPFRSAGTYSKYNSIDDKIDDLHYYTAFIKFGLGRASYDASQEIRNKHLTRDEGVALVRKFDGEFPDRYFNEVMEYIGMKPDHFHELCDQFRSPHLWKNQNGSWALRHKIS